MDILRRSSLSFKLFGQGGRRANPLHSDDQRKDGQYIGHHYRDIGGDIDVENLHPQLQ
jgi:hypothetical protein